MFARKVGNFGCVGCRSTRSAEAVLLAKQPLDKSEVSRALSGVRRGLVDVLTVGGRVAVIPEKQAREWHLIEVAVAA